MPELDLIKRGGKDVMNDCGNFLVCLTYLPQGSLPGGNGDPVTTCRALAEVGNSREPHMHANVQSGPASRRAMRSWMAAEMWAAQEQLRTA